MVLAASNLINAEGVDALSIRRVAEVSNYGRSTVVHQFGSKEGLLDAIHLVAIEAATKFAVENNYEGAPMLEFKAENLGFWELMRTRKCPDFEKSDAPFTWRAMETFVGGPVTNPGATIDLVFHQVLAMYDWMEANGSDNDDCRPKLAVDYWHKVLGFSSNSG